MRRRTFFSLSVFSYVCKTASLHSQTGPESGKHEISVDPECKMCGNVSKTYYYNYDIIMIKVWNPTIQAHASLSAPGTQNVDSQGQTSCCRDFLLLECTDEMDREVNQAVYVAIFRLI